MLPVLVTLAVWAGIVVLFAAQFVVLGSLSWSEAMKHAGSFWAVWALFMPLVVWLSLRIPLEKKSIFLCVTIHLVACFLVVTISQFVARELAPDPPRPPHGEMFKPHEAERREFPPLRERDHKIRPPRPNNFGGLRAGFDLLIYWAIVAVCQSISLFRRSQQRERRAVELEARLTRARLDALRMQINPHFLFNTLNAICALVYTNPQAADEMIGDLSDLLRNSLDTKEQHEITLRRELEFLRCYLDIEQRRFGDRLRVEQNISSDVLDAFVPTLILQPIVENAVRHGIEPQKEAGVITISARRDGDNLQLTVSDNGKGLLEKTEGSGKRSEGGGIGLSNSRARLRELYGDEQNFSIGQGMSGGCTVEIKIPFHQEPITPPASPEINS